MIVLYVKYLEIILNLYQYINLQELFLILMRVTKVRI